MTDELGPVIAILVLIILLVLTSQLGTIIDAAATFFETACGGSSLSVCG